MNADIVKRLKGWFYLRLSPEDWTKFGTSAAQVLQTFDDDPDQEYQLLRFAHAVIMLDPQKNDFRIVKQRLRELRQLGIDMEQFKKVWERMFKM